MGDDLGKACNRSYIPAAGIGCGHEGGPYLHQYGELGNWSYLGSRDQFVVGIYSLTQPRTSPTDKQQVMKVMSSPNPQSSPSAEKLWG